MVRIAVLFALTLLLGCAPTKTVYIDRPVEVLIPVPVRAAAPAWLSSPYTPDSLPLFIHPSDPAAKAALSEQGLADLKVILRMFKERDLAWREWASDPESTNVQPQ